MDIVRIYTMVMEVVVVVLFIVSVYMIVKKLPEGFLVEAVKDSNGNISSTRIKSLMSAFLALFLTLIGTVGIAPVKADFVLILLGYAGVEHGAEKIKDVSLNRFSNKGK